MNIAFPYVAQANPEAAMNWVSSHGLPPAESPQVLASQMQHIVDQRGEEGLKEFARIHPDQELFQSYLGSDKKHSNACGCSGSDGYSNANGQSIKAEVEKMINGKDRDSKIELMILAGTILVALALITKK